MGLPAILYPTYVEGQELIQGCELMNEDFVQGPCASSTDDAASFDLVGTSAALTLADNALNGVGTLVSNSTNGAYLIQNGEPIKLAANRKIYLEFKGVQITSDVASISFVAGAGITNADPFTTSWTDWVSFFTVTGSAVLYAGTGMNSTNVPGSGTSGTLTTFASTGITLVASTEYRLNIVIDGTGTARFYVNGVLTNTITTTLPTDEYLAIHFGGIGSSETMLVDRIYGYQS